MPQEITSFKHRSQIGRMKLFIRENLYSGWSLDDLSDACKISKFHLIRLFSEYTGETPFEYANRMKLCGALNELKDKQKSVTDIALNAGFSTPSSFNKSFRKGLRVSPSEFRSYNEDKMNQLIKSLSSAKADQEAEKSLDLDTDFQTIERSVYHLLILEILGQDFSEIAPAIWPDFLEQISMCSVDLSHAEFLGVSSIDERGCRSYKAAVGFGHFSENVCCHLDREVLPESKYAKFLLKGPYSGIWSSFNVAFKKIHKMGFSFSHAPAIERYLNDPQEVEERELLTEILIPIL